MAKSNRNRIGDALDILNAGLAPFVEREMQAEFGDEWQDKCRQSWRENRDLVENGRIQWDTHALLTVMWDHWTPVFKKTLGRAERSLISELRTVRNDWAHQKNFSTDDAYRALDSMDRLLQAVSAPEARQLDEVKQELLRIRFEEQRRYAERKATAAVPAEAQVSDKYKPWRMVVTPHPDVASGKYQQAEFAADLWQVYQREGADEYKKPDEFFKRTFLTDGLSGLLVNAAERLSGNGGDPVVELQTNFGGGKTHSMLALYHLFSGAPTSDLVGVDNLLEKHKLAVPASVRRAVFVGTKVSPGMEHKKPDGTVVRTMWGEIAWQLGGKDGYKLVKDADQTATNPGDRLTELFNKYSPCLVLIDEWVAYARQLHEDRDLPAGTFDTQFTFAQALTECAKAAKNTLVVISIPASDSADPTLRSRGATDIEIGGERGRAALERLKNAIGRVESSWRPASQEEGYEIVRRRLFQPLRKKEDFIARDHAAKGFSDTYASQFQEFPPECREGDYERRIKSAYPIHPEVFERLYRDWSTLEKFQRTRGVLRLMAAVIHCLWERQDNSLLIMPSNIPIDDAGVQSELTRYLEDHWVPVIESDVDGPHSLPLSLDRDNPNLGRYSAARRVARTIYLGSAPLQKASNKGVDERQVKLGCVQPGESVATFGDALRRLTDQATYLYVDGKRYWCSTQPTVTKLADDRAHSVHEHQVTEEIERRLRAQAGYRGDFTKVHVCCSSSDISDDMEARLVVLGPQFSHARNTESTALKEAAEILDYRGNIPRNYANMLVFLAADANRLRELEEAVRYYIAWTSIWAERETLNLDAYQTKQAETKCGQMDETVDSRIYEAYQWLLVPEQPDPKGPVQWDVSSCRGQEALAVKVSKKLRNDGRLLTQLAGPILKLELDKIPLWRGDHVSVKQLVEDFARYNYLPTVKDANVLYSAIQDGVSRLTWEDETFAYADRWDEATDTYVGLQAGRQVQIVPGADGVIVQPAVAGRHLAAGKAADDTTRPRAEDEGARGEGGQSGATTTPTPEPKAEPKLSRFHGSATLDPMRVGRDASQIAQEVIQHINGLVKANVKVTLEIQAEVPEGTPDDVVRIVTENCRTLKFNTFGFEEE